MSSKMRDRAGWAAAAALVVGGVLLGMSGPAPAGEESGPGILLHNDTIEDARRWAEAGQSIEASTQVPGAWCGDFRADDNLANEVPRGGPRWHLVVAVPADVALSPAYQTVGQRWLADDAFATVKILENYYTQRVGVGNVGQTAHGWTLRFDYGTTCGPTYPDISFYHLPRTAQQYGSQPFFGIQADLDASNKFERSDRRYLVHYVGPSIYCGQSYIYNPTDASGGVKYSIVYNFDRAVEAVGVLGGTPTTGGTGGLLCNWSTDAHEMGHSMGAAVGGPQNNDGAHTWDCYNDIMSYGGTPCGDGVLYFDWQENNYFDHPGGWYDTNLSASWCKPTC